MLYTSSHFKVKAGNPRIPHLVEGNLRAVRHTLQLPDVVRVVLLKNGKGVVVDLPSNLGFIGRQEIFVDYLGKT